VLGVVLSVAILWWAMRDVSVAEVWEVLRDSEVIWFVLAATVATLAFPVRAWRWRYLLRSVASDLPYGALWRSTAIGFMVNNVAVARAGELARAFALTREDPRVRFTTALGSLVVDRVFDTVAILLFLVASMLVPAFPRDTVLAGRPVAEWAVLLGGFAALALAGLTALALYPRVVLSVWETLVGRVAPRLSARGARLLEGFTTGLGALRNPKLFAVVMAWTLLQWLINAVSFWLAFHAVDIDAPFSAAVFGQSVLAISVALPSTPGFFGLFEGAAVAAFSVYGVPEAVSFSYAVGYHILSFIPITVMGLWYFARLGLHFRDLGGGGGAPPAGPSAPADDVAGASSAAGSR
jgi:uncharacterized protein (TIRG00374 family)